MFIHALNLYTFKLFKSIPTKNFDNNSNVVVLRHARYFAHMYVCMYVCMYEKKNSQGDFRLISFTAGHLGMPLIPRRPVT